MHLLPKNFVLLQLFAITSFTVAYVSTKAFHAAIMRLKAVDKVSFSLGLCVSHPACEASCWSA